MEFIWENISLRVTEVPQNAGTEAPSLTSLLVVPVRLESMALPCSTLTPRL